MAVLLYNAGSSSLKGTLVDSDSGDVVARCRGEWAGTTPNYMLEIEGQFRETSPSGAGHGVAAMRFLNDIQDRLDLDLNDIEAVGHRFVHGGSFTESIRITPAIQEKLDRLSTLAPLHNPLSLAVLQSMTTALSHVPQVAVFDTAFHASLDPEAYCYALPRSWREDWGIRRYGFHGLSHSYCSKRAAEMLGRNIEDVRLIVCHLGHGCSATAIRHGRCVDTTMGFTPLDGLVMATRCGELDPGIVLYVQREHGLSPGEIESILNRESGLHGLTGISGDMREVLAASESGNADARLAIEIYARRIRKTIGAYLAVLQGVDAIVFTAGVGENAPRIRQQVCQGLGFLGIEIDEALNSQARPDADVASKSSRCRIFVIATNEERTMYEEVVRVLKN